MEGRIHLERVGELLDRRRRQHGCAATDGDAQPVGADLESFQQCRDSWVAIDVQADVRKRVAAQELTQAKRGGRCLEPISTTSLCWISSSFMRRKMMRA